MKRISTIYLHLLLLLVFTLQVSAQTPGLEGNWMGALDIGGGKVRFVLKIEKARDGYKATFDSIDQGARDLAIDTVTANGDKLSFSAAQFMMSYEGTVNDAKNEISGTFKQGTASTPFTFRRINEIPAGIVRPQDPKKPYPYDEEDVSYKNAVDNVKLAGTLTMPRSPGKHPAVILISGSGAQDRDSLIYGHRPFLVLADHLTRNGIAVLRVDDRGTGRSELGSLDATSENFMGDVLAGVQYLKTRLEIDQKKIGLIGHSEGGMIAPLAAARSRDVAFVIMLAGLGQRGEDVVYTQNELLAKAGGSPATETARAVELAKKAIAIIKAEADGARIEQGINNMLDAYIASLSEDERKQAAPVLAGTRSSISIFKTPWYRYFVAFDPAPVLRNVTVPVLALNGENDLQIAYKENLSLIEAALKAGGNKDVTVKSFPLLNHLFQTSKTGHTSEYGKIDETMSPAVLTTITDWIAKRTR